MAKQYGIDINKVIRLMQVAKQGRSKSARTRAANELTKVLVREVNRANARMRSLEKAGLDYGQAYDTATAYLDRKGRSRFSTSTRDLDAAYEEFLRARAFMSSPQSTVRGQRAIVNKRNMEFRSKWGFGNTSDSELEDFQRFLGNQSVQTYLSFYADSGDAVEELSAIFDEGNERDKVADLFREYEKFRKWREENPTRAANEAEGITFSELRKGIDNLYESIEKRRR